MESMDYCGAAGEKVLAKAAVVPGRLGRFCSAFAEQLPQASSLSSQTTPQHDSAQLQPQHFLTLSISTISIEECQSSQRFLFHHFLPPPPQLATIPHHNGCDVHHSRPPDRLALGEHPLQEPILNVADLRLIIAQLAIGTLGGTFGLSYWATRSPAKKSTNEPPINAQSKEEESFVKYARLGAANVTKRRLLIL